MTNKQIRSELTKLELLNSMKVILAVESGSRPWGFSSDDSHWDIRFIYKRPVRHLVTLFSRRDTIEHSLEIKGEKLDIVGWELNKAMKLLMKSNAQPFEWLDAFPIVNSPEAALLRRHSTPWFKPVALVHHYRGLATSNWMRYIQGREVVRQKRYLYVVRGVANAQWVIEHGLLPPQRLNDCLLAITLPNPFYSEALALLERKRTGELTDGPRIKALDDFPPIWASMPVGPSLGDEKTLDAVYREIINWP